MTINLTTRQSDASYPKLTVSITDEQWAQLAQALFGWRSTTKRYATYKERINKLGTSNYDKLISFAHDNVKFNTLPSNKVNSENSLH